MPKPPDAMTSREEIRNVLSRFMNCFDLKDWTTMTGLLEPIIEVDYADLRGDPAKEISAVEYVRLRSEALQHLRTQHLLTNVDVATGDDKATVRASCMIHRSDGTRHFNTHALYTFSLVPSDGTWRIAGIEQRVLWNEGDPSIHRGTSLRRA